LLDRLSRDYWLDCDVGFSELAVLIMGGWKNCWEILFCGLWLLLNPCVCLGLLS
jgi:hypothetical protein